MVTKFVAIARLRENGYNSRHEAFKGKGKGKCIYIARFL